MANKDLFRGQISPEATVTNEAGGKAYKLSSEEALAQFACTGCFNGTYYATAGDQLESVKNLVSECRPEFVAKVAVYSRKKGYMKDMPAFMLAHLAAKGETQLLKQVFPTVIDNGRMLRNFVQIIRSGVLGRKSFGTSIKKMIQTWLNVRHPERLFKDSVGNDPSLADVIKMVHTKPVDEERTALFGYLIGKDVKFEALPEVVQQYEHYKKHKKGPVPNVEFRMLTSLGLGKEEWTEIARNAPWHMTRMNLNTFLRHGVFEDKVAVRVVAERLANPKLIAKAKVFPYQLLMAYTATADRIPVRSGYGWQSVMGTKVESGKMPNEIINALHDALEISVDNVPQVMMHDGYTTDGGIEVPETPAMVYVFPDVSGSMGSPVTGNRRGSSTKMSCREVAALVASAVLRKNPTARVIPFDTNLHETPLSARDSVMTNAQKLGRFGGGGTHCSLPLALLNQEKAKGDLIVYVSDNESWVDSLGGQRRYGWSRGTSVMDEWKIFKRRNPHAKMINIDIQPYGTVQAPNTPDILNVGGFSDSVFELMAQFVKGKDSKHWVDVINQIEL